MEFPGSNTTHFNLDFSLSMTSQVLLKQVEMGSNFVSSPLSFHLMLSLVAAGSTGRTLERLLSVLGTKSASELNYVSSQIITLISIVQGDSTKHSFWFQKLKDIFSPGLSSFMPPQLSISALPEKNRKRPANDPSLSYICGVWVDRTFRLTPAFETIAKDIYKARTDEVDFAIKAEAIRDEVNLWAEKETGGFIKEVLPTGSIDRNTALILANALHFKGAWEQEFDTRKTKRRDFYLLNGQIVRVPFMTGKQHEDYLYSSFDGYKVLQLPYQSGHDSREFSMFFFLPDERDGLSKLVNRFSFEPGFFSQQFSLRRKELPDFWIPKFKFAFEFEAMETMKDMGLDHLFLNLGELTGMASSTNNEKLYLSKMFQKSYIEIDDKGTEAASCTAGYARFLCAYHPTPSFVADHPFMFMIREENSGLVLFTGAVLNPLLES